LDPDVTILVRQLDRLRWLKRDQQPTEEEQLMQDVAAQNVPPKPAAEISEDSRGERVLLGDSEISIAS
jgi:hypothetical protein